MKTPLWKPVKLPIWNGYDITLKFEPEHTRSRTHFISECKWSEAQYRPIRNYYWFSAAIIASSGGIALGHSYLGCCCYKNLYDVTATELDGYLPQLIDEATSEACLALPEVITTHARTLNALTTTASYR